LKRVSNVLQTGNRKNDKIAYNKMTQLRREFERSRMLLEMIKKREKLKRDQIQIAFELFELRLVHPPPNTHTPHTANTHTHTRTHARTHAHTAHTHTNNTPHTPHTRNTP
jgi:hypothetical protein